jgi:hypothetical protein
MFRRLRILILLLVLATVAQSAWLARSRAAEWKSSLQVTVYPIAGDGSAATAETLARLREEQFEPIERFLEREARRHGIATLRPVDVSLAPVVSVKPPDPPGARGALDTVLWSLHLRWWAWRHDETAGPKPQIRLFVLFHDPDRTPALPHSLGLQKGLIGVVHVFAGRLMASQNQVVMAHELLHTLGASDKYDPATNLPIHPAGYAEPQRRPRHPQELAEIMGGRVPLSDTEAEMPDSLEQVVVGPETAAEIGWIRK